MRKLTLSFSRENEWILKWFQRKARLVKLLDPAAKNTAQSEMLKVLEGSIGGLRAELARCDEDAVMVWTAAKVPPALQKYVTPATLYLALGNAEWMKEGMRVRVFDTPDGPVTIIEVDNRGAG